MVHAYKYLGIWISDNGNYSKARQFLANQGKKAIFALQRVLRNLECPPIPVALKLFDTLISPILSYGCEIWGFAEDREMETTELRFLKYILHLPPSASNMAVRGELGQLPIHLLWREKILKYWNRLCSEHIPKLLKEAALLAISRHQSGQNNWVARVQGLFNGAGCSSAYTAAGGGQGAVKRVMLRYRDHYLQHWTRE